MRKLEREEKERKGIKKIIEGERIKNKHEENICLAEFEEIVWIRK